MFNFAGKKQSTPDGKHKNKEAPNQTSPLNNFSEEQIINDLANEVNCKSVHFYTFYAYL